VPHTLILVLTVGTRAGPQRKLTMAKEKMNKKNKKGVEGDCLTPPSMLN